MAQSWLSVVVVVVIAAVFGCERDSAKHFASVGRSNSRELSQPVIPVLIPVSSRQRRGVEAVRDLHELVRVGALIAIVAERRNDGEKSDASVRLIRSRVTHLLDAELSDLVDVRRNGWRLGGHKELDASRGDEIYSNLRRGELARGEAAVIVVAGHVIEPIRLDDSAAVITAVAIPVGPRKCPSASTSTTAR